MRRLPLLLALLVTGCFFGYRHDDPSHPNPAIDIGATMPAVMMLPLTAATEEVRDSTLLMPAAASMTAIMAGAISTCSTRSCPTVETE